MHAHVAAEIVGLGFFFQETHSKGIACTETARSRAIKSSHLSFRSRIAEENAADVIYYYVK